LKYTPFLEIIEANISGSYLRFEIRDHIHFNTWWEIWSGLTLEKIKK